jgi:hypothetical protein
MLKAQAFVHWKLQALADMQDVYSKKPTPLLPSIPRSGLKFRGSVAISQQDRPVVPHVHRCNFLIYREATPQSRPAVGRDRMKRLDAAKLERLGRLLFGPLWQSELARTIGVSRQTVLRWMAGESKASPEHTAKAKDLVRARIGQLQRLLKQL